LNQPRAIACHARDFFDFTLFLGLLRGIFPEKVILALAKLMLQHPLDAHGPSHCMSRARFFSLN
jgi:hypothetical protein